MWTHPSLMIGCQLHLDAVTFYFHLTVFNQRKFKIWLGRVREKSRNFRFENFYEHCRCKRGSNILRERIRKALYRVDKCQHQPLKQQNHKQQHILCYLTCPVLKHQCPVWSTDVSKLNLTVCFPQRTNLNVTKNLSGKWILRLHSQCLIQHPVICQSQNVHVFDKAICYFYFLDILSLDFLEMGNTYFRINVA